MRKLAALALLVIPAIAHAEWTGNERAIWAFACREAGGNTTLCACTVKTLEEIQPDAKQVTEANVGEAVDACTLPPNTKDTVSI